MVRTAIQLYTVRGLDEPPWDVVARVGETAFDGVELYDAHFDAFGDAATLRRTVTALEEAELAVAGAHASIDRLESSLEDVVATCRALDCRRIVVPSYDTESFATRDGVAAAADRIADLAADLGERDIELLYHNHGFEFGTLDGGGVAFEAFVDRADGRFDYEPDVGLARHVGFDPLRLLDLVGEHAPVVHLTDTVPDDPDRPHADVGDGVVDTEACAVAAAEHGAEWLVCENGVTEDAARSLARGSEAFADLRRRAGDVTTGR